MTDSQALPTPYYQDERVTLFHANCLDILPLLPKVDLCLTDPPYGIDYNTNYGRFSGGNRWGNKWDKVSNDDKPFDPKPLLDICPNVITWGANCYSQKLPIGSWLIWDKRFKNGEAFLADAEAAWMSKGFGVYIYSLTSQGYTHPDGKRVHPTQKPVALMKWCIEKFPKANLILDCYAGSCSVGVAAKQLGKKAILIEIEEKYCEAGAKRLSQEELF